MANSDWLTIRVRLQDAARTEAGLAAIGAEVKHVGTEIGRTAEKTRLAKIETFGWNEGLYVLKRHIATLVLPMLALDGAVIKMGYDFNEAKASGTDALASLVGGVAPARKEMAALIGLTHDSGLSLNPLVAGARNLLTFGFSLRQTNAYLKTFAAFSQAKRLGAGGVESLVGLYEKIKNRGFFTSRDAQELTQLGIPSTRALTQGLHLSRTDAWRLQHGQLEIPSSYALPALTGYIRSYSSRIPKPLSEQFGIAKSWLAQLFGGFTEPLFAKLEKDAPKINAFLGRLTKGFEHGGTGGFFRALDPSGTALKGWIILTNAARALWTVITALWNVVKLGVPLLGLVGSILGVVAKHTLILKVAVYGLAAAYLYSKIELLALTGVTKGAAIATALYEFWVLRAEYAQWALNAAMDANPVGALILGITAAAAGFYLLYTRVGWFRDSVNGTWSWIRANWPLLAEIIAAPFTFGLSLALTHLGTLWNWLKGLWGWLNNHVFRMHFGSSGGGLLNLIPGYNLAHAGVNAGVSLLHGLVGGGTTTSPGAVMIGERGPEILNLPRGATVTPLRASVAPITGPAGFADLIAAVAAAVEQGFQHVTIPITSSDMKVDGKKLAQITFTAAGTDGARA